MYHSFRSLTRSVVLWLPHENFAHSYADAELIGYGQEINDQTFAICKADMLIKGGNPDYIKDANTLSDDRFKNHTFDYILSNPPFGREWKNEQKAITGEAKLGKDGRFGVGLPAVDDGQMLFLLTAISKIKPSGSRIAIIHNGSPLFTGDAGSGPSEIRRHIIENDLLEAIIALPNDIFYNTGIATYIWVLSNKKAAHRKGKIQLINANGMFEKRRKSLGKKRNDIPKHYIDEITKIYGDFRESEISKIFDNSEFGYRKITVERPLRDENGKIVLKKGNPEPDKSLRDTESVPFSRDIHYYFEREVLPHVPDGWIDESKTKIGYEIPFTRYFYKYTPPRPSRDIMAEILEIEKHCKGRLAVIPEAITKGLDPNVPMKDSGIPWIGEIPEEWHLEKLKNSVQLINAKSEDVEQPYIGLENIESWNAKYLATEAQETTIEGNLNTFMCGDVLFGKLRPYLAKAMIAEFNDCCSSELLVLRNFRGDNRFLLRLLLSSGFIDMVNSSTYGSKMPRASWDFIGQMAIPLPKAEEQEAISDYLDTKTAEIDAHIADITEQIEKLREYRRSIIFEAVTGKVEL